MSMVATLLEIDCTRSTYQKTCHILRRLSHRPLSSILGRGRTYLRLTLEALRFRSPEHHGIEPLSQQSGTSRRHLQLSVIMLVFRAWQVCPTGQLGYT